MKTWYVKLRKDSAILKTMTLNLLYAWGLFTVNVEKADEELQMEFMYSATQYSVKFVRLVYQIFTLSSPGIDSQKLLNLRTKYVQCLQHMHVQSCFRL
jgi:hypothetical protein